MSDRVPTAPPDPSEGVADGTAADAGLPPDALAAARVICPYLIAEAGDWRTLAPAREHVCTAVDPPAPLAIEKQRRLCLSRAHVECATFVAAQQVREMAPGRPVLAGGEGRWPIPRTAPVIIDRGGPSLASLHLDRTAVQGGLVVLMIVAFMVLAFARLTAPGDRGPGSGSSPSPASSAAPSVAPSVVPSPSPQPSVRPSPSPTAAASTAPTATPPASPVATASTAATTRTYTIRSGDTLSAVAGRFGTTVAVLRELNDIADPSLLRVGQVLRIP
jgi:LysM repeat protein